MRSEVTILFALWAAATSAFAQGDFYKGMAAYKSGDYAGAAGEWTSLARQGHPEAQYYLARMHRRGEIERDDARAAELYRGAAERGHPMAQNDLGMLYEEGSGVEQDYAAAAHWYGRAAEQALATAQFNLGRLYDLGRGVGQDGETAARWYRRAADQGHLKAQVRLALMYDRGQGVEADPAAAANWYREAAKQDHGPSAATLGAMYEEGRGVSRDPKKAAKWYGRASALGVTARPTSAEERAPIDPADEPAAGASVEPREVAGAPTPVEPPGDGPEVDPDAEPALESLDWETDLAAPDVPDLELAERGDPEAQYRLAQRYSTGQGVPRNLNEAVRWYLEAANGGHGLAGYKLAHLYLKGRVTPEQDYVQAHAWFSLSADRGIGDAAEWRDKIAKKMTEEELERSAALVRDRRAGR
jgi:TPR repeat protein